MNGRCLLRSRKVGHQPQITLHPLRRSGIHKSLRHFGRFAKIAARRQHKRPRAPCGGVILLQQRHQHGIRIGFLPSKRQRNRLPDDQIVRCRRRSRQPVVLLRTRKVTEQIECKRAVGGNRPVADAQTDSVVKQAQRFEGVFCPDSRRRKSGNNPAIARADDIGAGEEVERCIGITQNQRCVACISQRVSV